MLIRAVRLSRLDPGEGKQTAHDDAGEKTKIWAVLGEVIFMWNQCWLWVKLSENLCCRCCLGLLNPIITPSFLSHATGEQSKVAPVTASTELCHQNLENCFSFFFVLSFLFFSLFLSLQYNSFEPKRFYVAVCRLELNAADWNLNCDL